MLENVIGSTSPATLLVGMVPVQVPRPAPMKVCAAVLLRFVGRSSVMRMLVSPPGFGLVIVKVTVEVPLVAIELGENALVTVGGAHTTRLPVAAAPGFTAVSVADTVPVVFGCPAATLMTFEVTTTVIVQLAPAASEGTASVSAVAPPVIDAGVVPVHVPPGACVPDTDMFTSVSLKVALVSAFAAFGLVSVKVITLVAPVWIAPGTNALASDGGDRTVRDAVLETAPAVGVWVDVTPLAVLLQMPETPEVSVTVTVQLAPAPSEGTVRLSAVAPAASDGELVVPTQVPPIVAGLATDILVNASVKFRLVSGTVFPFAIVKVTTLVPPWLMVVVPNALAMVGGLATESVAVLEPVPAAPVSVVATPEAVLV